MMNDPHIDELIERYIQKTATLSEQQELQDWFYNQNVEEVVWAEGDSSTELDEEEQTKKRMLLHIQARMQPQQGSVKTVKLFRRIAAAAAILLVVGAGLFFYTSSRHLEGSVATRDLLANDVKPGGNKAYLTLANGKKLSLSDAANGALAKEAGVEITKTADGQIIYTTRPLEGGTTERPVNGRSLPGVEMTGKVEMTNTIETPKGGQYQVRLPDGTKVWLNAASKLIYPVSFNGREERRVELSGEAYFEVAKIMMQSHTITIATSSGTAPMIVRVPFLVKSRGQEVQVLGTHFNINSYANEPTTKTTLLEGSVAVNLMKDAGVNPGFRLGKSVTLEPNQQSVLTGETVQVVKVDAELAVSWKNGQFAYKNTQLQTVMNQIARWYDVEIIYENESLKQKLLSGSVSRYANVSGILKAIESTGTAKFKIEGKTIKVQQ